MSLAGELTGAGTPPGRLDVRCTITMDEVEGQGHQIVHSALDVRARVPGRRRGAASTRRSRPRTRAARSRRSCATPASASTITTTLEGGD